MSYVPNLLDSPSPNHSARKPGVRVDTVLIHHTATEGATSALAWLANPTSRVSAHYVIGLQGWVYRLVHEERKAWHAGKGRLPWETCEEYDFNHRSIGVEVVNPGDGKTPFTEAQYRALEWLVPDILSRWSCSSVRLREEAPTRRVPYNPPYFPAYVLGHRDIAPGRKTDPADNFDWGRIRVALAAPRRA